MGMLEQLGIEVVHLIGLAVGAVTIAMVRLWVLVHQIIVREDARAEARALEATERDKQVKILHQRITDHEAEWKSEIKELRALIHQLQADIKTLTGKLEVWTNQWAKSNGG